MAESLPKWAASRQQGVAALQTQSVLEAGYGLGGACGTFMAGYLYDQFGSYTTSFFLVLGAIIFSCVAFCRTTAHKPHATS